MDLAGKNGPNEMGRTANGKLPTKDFPQLCGLDYKLIRAVFWESLRWQGR